jgi:glycine/D-amino acid oxidase-like deaminating enzyme
MVQAKEHYDIAIIGGGITGLSAAYHLSQTSYRVCISENAYPESTSEASAEMITGGFIDNYTRIAQRHGNDLAKSAWTYSCSAFDETIAFAKGQGIPYEAGQRLRLIETEDEKTESLKAVQQLRKAGFASEFDIKLPLGSHNLLGIQVDGPRAAWIEKDKLLNVLRLGSQRCIRRGFTQTLTRDNDHFLMTTTSGPIRAELVILASHLGIRTLLPNLKEALVPSQDQWLRFRTKDEAVIPFPIGTVLTWRHGHYWAQVERKDRLCLGGARFLRPLAGFEASKAELSEKISTHLPEAWAKYFPGIRLEALVDQKPGLDIRPCDELPLIGPMFGESGVFIGTGYMGQGLSLGFKAGQSLASIVLGKKDDLPRCLWPERLRNLEP